MPNRPICLTCRPTLGCLGAMGFFSDRIAHPLCLATCTLLLGCWSSEESGKPAVVAPEEVLITTKVALDRVRVEYEKAKEACRECAEEHGCSATLLSATSLAGGFMRLEEIRSGVSGDAIGEDQLLASAAAIEEVAGMMVSLEALTGRCLAVAESAAAMRARGSEETAPPADSPEAPAS